MFHGLGLLKVEVQTIFRFADVNKNQRVEKDEWNNFYKLFLEGFIKCDSSQDFLVDLEELKKCEDLEESFNKNKLTSEFVLKVYGKRAEESVNLDPSVPLLFSVWGVGLLEV